MDMPGIQDLIQSLVGGGGGMGGPGMSPGGMGGPGGMPAPPPSPPPGPMGQPEIPSGDSNELGSQVKSLATQLSHIGAQLMSRGIHDGAISCAKAVKELDKVPEAIANHMQANPPPSMGEGGMMGMGGPPGMPPMGPPPLPGMS